MNREALSDDEYESARDDVGSMAGATMPPDTRTQYGCGHPRVAVYAKCQTCVGEKNRTRVDALRDVIVELKNSVDSPISSEEERRLVKLLTEYGHPDVDRFLRSLQEQRERGASKKKGGRR